MTRHVMVAAVGGALCAGCSATKTDDLVSESLAWQDKIQAEFQQQEAAAAASPEGMERQRTEAGWGEFTRLVARTRVGDSFTAFNAQLQDIRTRTYIGLENSSELGDISSRTYKFWWPSSPSYVTVMFRGDKIVSIDRGGIPPRD